MYLSDTVLTPSIITGKPTDSLPPFRPVQNNRGHPDRRNMVPLDLNTQGQQVHQKPGRQDLSSEVRRGRHSVSHPGHHSGRLRDYASMDPQDQHRPGLRGHCRQAHRDRNSKGHPDRRSLCNYRCRGPWRTTRTQPAPGQ